MPTGPSASVDFIVSLLSTGALLPLVPDKTKLFYIRKPVPALTIQLPQKT